jgi:hypothetical protein
MANERMLASHKNAARITWWFDKTMKIRPVIALVCNE